LAPTTIAIQSSENPSIDGDAVTLTATITAANGGANSTLVGPPTGNLDFTITGPSGTYTCQDGNPWTTGRPMRTWPSVSCLQGR
jgi:hypothetical protein